LQPSLSIASFGEIGLPLLPAQTEDIAKAARKAPFGKGMHTVTDTSVRSAWEIDAADVSFANPTWAKYLSGMVEVVKDGLGLDSWNIEAHLYKLLLYEQGDFFLPHKDSEKEKGMFGTMVVGLPSKHEDGELLVRLDGQESVIDFSKVPSYEIPYTAFFADCEHEIRPVTSGYRLCLTYNLVQIGSPRAVPGATFPEQIEDMTALFKQHFNDFEDSYPKAILLDHQYTPTNFSIDILKLHDKPRAEAIIEAAEKAGLSAKLTLVTHHLSGELETEYRSSRRRRHWDDDYDEDVL
jgi:2OG-Fe(II) oxygenase superfamily